MRKNPLFTLTNHSHLATNLAKFYALTMFLYCNADRVDSRYPRDQRRRFRNAIRTIEKSLLTVKSILDDDQFDRLSKEEQESPNPFYYYNESYNYDPDWGTFTQTRKNKFG
jgi:hypothetical protein